MEDEGDARQPRRRRRRRRRPTAKPAAPEVESDGGATPKPAPTRRQAEARKSRGNVPNPDRSGISTSMAMRAREVSPPGD